MSEQAVREEVRSFVKENWDESITLREWWRRLADAGFTFPSWPEGFGGRGLSGDEARAVGEELNEARVIGAPGGLGQMMGGPVVLDHGNDEQKREWVSALARGEESWCQLFSEPGAGSDLASLQTRAIRDGDVWIVNGQKVWTSGARTADRGMLVARTNPDAPKHRGITYFIIDMDQEGIEVRPLKQMNGAATFNEVFFSDAVVDNSRVVGQVNDGWMLAVSTLAYERSGIGGRGGAAPRMGIAQPGKRNGMLDKTVGELMANARNRRGGDEMAAFATRTAAAMRDVAAKVGKADDPVVRQRIAGMHAFQEANRMSILRARSAMQAGKMPGPEVSTSKLAGSITGRTARDLGLGILGAHGMLLGEDAPDNGAIAQMALGVQSGSIAGGTDEIQRNILGERVLGLPKEPQVDRDVPFKELKVGTQQKPA